MSLSYSQKQNWVLILLCCLYAVGLLGVSWPLHPEFMRLTPLNLLTTFGLCLWAEKQQDKRLYLALLAVYWGGWFLELAGVQTGLIFGEYSYGATLGPQLGGTPFMIGLNWAMLVYASSSIILRFFSSRPLWLRSLLGASLMVSLDLFIEPAAVRYDMWSWGNTPYNSLLVAPWQNYAVWWLAAFGLQLFFGHFLGPRRNPALEFLFLWQFVFFLWIYLFLLM